MGLNVASVLHMLGLTTPASAPPANSSNLYVKADGHLYLQDSNGNEWRVDAGPDIGDMKMIGQVMTTIGSGTIPSSITLQSGVWLLCDGTAIVRTTWQPLYNVIGTTFGTGDGSTTFNLPDFKSRFPVGAGTYEALGKGDTSAEASRGTNHTHTISAPTGMTGVAVGTGAANAAPFAGVTTHDHGGNTAGGYGRAVFPHLGVNFIIKA